MKIVFFGNAFSIFGSSAATNLVYAFALGFQENGCHSVLITMDNEYAEPRGFIGPVEYYIPLEKTKRNELFVIRNLYKLKKYVNIIRYLRNQKRKEESVIQICFSDSVFIMIFSFLLKILYFDMSLIYLVEHPLRFKKKLNSIIVSLYKIVFSILFNGQIFISEGLRNCFRSRKNNLVVPSMVVFERFAANRESPFPFEYIGYCGTIARGKDGVHIMIEGFEKISEKYPLLNLLIMGDFPDDSERHYFQKLTATPELADRVVYTGKISKNEMPTYLKAAKILSLARPKNLQSDTGFPTKLPEYLATGKPVVITKVGDIPKYLKNGENAFIVEPDDTDAIAEAFEVILAQYAKALEVGARGQQLAKTVFSPRYQARRVIDFISEIKEAN
jgi:glycosyltransferase involved in cell wall biosynthesis